MFDGMSLVHPVTLGRQAGRPLHLPCYESPVLSSPLSLTISGCHTCTCPPPLSRDSWHQGPPMLPHASALFFLGPGAAAETACTSGLLCALGPGSGMMGGGWRVGLLILLPLRSTIRFSPKHICWDSVSIQMLKWYSNLVNCQILKLPFSTCGKGPCEVARPSYAWCHRCVGTLLQARARAVAGRSLSLWEGTWGARGMDSACLRKQRKLSLQRKLRPVLEQAG